MLAELIDHWHRASTDFVDLVSDLPADAWDRPTDLPGWDVTAVVAHVAHLEHVVAGGTHQAVDIGAPEHVKNLLGEYTEQGVVARHGRTPTQLIAEITEARGARAAELAASPPDLDATAPDVFGLLGWTNETLLRNRIGDIWMHEQDVRRAAGQPGNLDGSTATFVLRYYLRGLGYAFGKGAGAAVGESVRIVLDGLEATVRVEPGGRARPAEVDQPTCTLTMSRETYAVLAGGRRELTDVNVTVDGDVELGRRVGAALAVTP